MKPTTQQISKQLSNGDSWSLIMRNILSEMPEESRGRVQLFAVMKDLCEVKIETLLKIGGWNYWPDGDDDDRTVDALLDGHISLKS